MPATGSSRDPLDAKPPARRFVSVGTKLVLQTFGVVVVAFVILFVNLTTRERRHALAGKQTAATMVVSLFFQSVSPRIDFDDIAGLRADVRNLSENPDIDGVAIYSREGELLGAWTRDGGPAPKRPDPRDLGTVHIDDERMTLYRSIIGAEEKDVGSATIVFSLERENSQRRESRLQIFTLTSALALGTALVLTLFARGQIIARLRTLAGAAERLERGEKNVRVELAHNDEITQLAAAFNLMGAAITERHARMASELEIAAHIQTSILPKDFAVKGIVIAATMKPATEVGGDYYDVLPTGDGCWVGIGDVSGHGVNAGLIMLMIQSIVAAYVDRDPETKPSVLMSAVNRILYENIRRRMNNDDHATLSMCRYRDDGTFTFAGAHEDIIVFRHRERRAELVATPGPWVGAVRDVSRMMVDTSIRIAEGDVVVLHTDGVTEARNAAGEMFGIERFVRAVEVAVGRGDVASICADLMDQVARWTSIQKDDVTLVVMKKADVRASEDESGGSRSESSA